MQKTMFHDCVSGWIDHYQNVAALEWLKRFIKNSGQKDDVKASLNNKIDAKVALLTDTALDHSRYDFE